MQGHGLPALAGWRFMRVFMAVTVLMVMPVTVFVTVGMAANLHVATQTASAFFTHKIKIPQPEAVLSDEAGHGHCGQFVQRKLLLHRDDKK